MFLGKYIASGFVLCGLVCSLLANPTQADARQQAKRIHDRLTGVPASDAMLDAMG